MKVERFANVWDALADSPAESASLTARSDLMIAIAKAVRAWGVSQEEAAARLQLTRPQVSYLLTGKISKFSLDALFEIAPRAGIKLTIAQKPMPRTAKAVLERGVKLKQKRLALARDFAGAPVAAKKLKTAKSAPKKAAKSSGAAARS